YTEGQRSSSLISTPKDASVMLQRYGKLRAQALDCRATVTLLEQMRGAL
ncbi:transcriptional regulator, partial [Streptomyces sp. TRM76130]|nr:transcriptional regulator [Streptomyces sp. TRM76130]